MKFGSVCSGIEAASVAWEPLGWEAAFFSEIEKFPCQLLKNHYPDVPNFGDMTKFKEWPDVSINLLCGGTPCQSFSIAGLRKGLGDDRGNLMLTFGEIASRYRPDWLVWENVPGVLSSNDGRDFAAFLGLLAGGVVSVPCDGWGNAGIIPGYESAYGLAYRVFDAQYFGVAQRRRRVFVVGYIGDWRPAAAVLFERESLSGHPAPSRETGQKVTGTLSARTGGGGGLGTDFECSEGLQVSAHRMVAFGEYADDNTASAIKARDYKDAPDLICSVGHTLKGEGFDASEDGTGRQNLVPIAFDSRQDPVSSEKVFGALGSSSPQAQAVAYGVSESPDLAHCLRAGASKADKHESTTYIKQNMAVRRLTPIECERLQGFPDNYTRISEKPADGPRYKALGNSWAVPNVRWIGQRIQMVEDILKEKGKK